MPLTTEFLKEIVDLRNFSETKAKNIKSKPFYDKINEAKKDLREIFDYKYESAYKDLQSIFEKLSLISENLISISNEKISTYIDTFQALKISYKNLFEYNNTTKKIFEDHIYVEFKKLEKMIENYFETGSSEANDEFTEAFKTHLNDTIASINSHMEINIFKKNEEMNELLQNVNSLKQELDTDLLQGGGKRKSKGKSKKVAKKPVVSQKKQSIYKEILGKQMKIYKMPDSRKEYVKYKGELLSISDYKDLMKQKAMVKTKTKTKATQQKAKSKTKK